MRLLDSGSGFLVKGDTSIRTTSNTVYAHTTHLYVDVPA